MRRPAAVSPRVRPRRFYSRATAVRCPPGSVSKPAWMCYECQKCRYSGLGLNPTAAQFPVLNVELPRVHDLGYLSRHKFAFYGTDPRLGFPETQTSVARPRLSSRADSSHLLQRAHFLPKSKDNFIDRFDIVGFSHVGARIVDRGLQFRSGFVVLVRFCPSLCGHCGKDGRRCGKHADHSCRSNGSVSHVCELELL